MKSYREIADSVFARREQYIVAQRKKKQRITRVTASVGSVALASLASLALYKSDVFGYVFPVSDGKPTTAVTDTPTEPGHTTTTTTVAPSATTDGGVVNPVTTVTTDAAPSKTQPTATNPSKTQPPAATTTPSKTDSVQTIVPTEPTATQTKPTIPTVPEKVLITGEGYDSQFDDLFDEGMLSFPNDRYLISSCLEKEMKQHKYEDVVYGVVVKVCPTQRIYDAFWESAEELTKFYEEYQAAYNAFVEEAKKLYPSWDGRDMSVIEVWSDTMRVKYDDWRVLNTKRNELEEQHRVPYYERVLEQRFEELVDFYGAEPLAVSFQMIPQERLCLYSYYLELTADQINTLAERSGYMFSLALPLDKLLGTMEFEELW